jgi:FeS assembly SUF system regulator
MLRISKLADYATVIMNYLTHMHEQAYNAAQIASATGIPLPTVRKILKQLQAAKLLHSQRGAEGGYHLARTASDIYLGEVIEAIDGPLALTECCAPIKSCVQETHCHTKNNWQSINKVVRDALYTIRLAQMTEKPAEVLIPVPSRKRG